MMRSLITFLLFSCAMPLAAAIGRSDGSSASAMPAGGYLEAMMGLLLVILLIFGLAWAVRRMGFSSTVKGNVRIIGGVSLGPRERALVLQVEGKRILVGVAPGQVRPLMRLDDADPDAVDEEMVPEQSPAFSRQLQSALNHLGGRKGAPESGGGENS
jgi:flagellar protein FliO/FliZ